MTPAFEAGDPCSNQGSGVRYYQYRTTASALPWCSGHHAKGNHSALSRPRPEFESRWEHSATHPVKTFLAVVYVMICMWTHEDWSPGEGCPDCGEETLIFTETTSREVWFSSSEMDDIGHGDYAHIDPSTLECSACGLLIAENAALETLRDRLGVGSTPEPEP